MPKPKERKHELRREVTEEVHRDAAGRAVTREEHIRVEYSDGTVGEGGIITTVDEGQED